MSVSKKIPINNHLGTTSFLGLCNFAGALWWTH